MTTQGDEMSKVTITAGGVTETIESVHAQLIGESIINGHDAFGDMVTCRTPDAPVGGQMEWHIETSNGLIVVSWSC